MAAQKRKLTDDQYTLACSLREERGLSIPHIIRSLKLNISKSTLLHHFLMDGVFPPNGRRPHPMAGPYQRAGTTVRPFTAEESARALQMERDGVSLGDIGKALGRSRNAVAYRLAALGYAMDHEAA